MTTNQTVRPLHIIARDIEKDWTKIYFGAVPYLQALKTLSTIKDDYGLDDAHTIIIYFLANAQTWKGEKAREIKKELKKIAGIK